jgi:hypothetical protein
VPVEEPSTASNTSGCRGSGGKGLAVNDAETPPVAALVQLEYFPAQSHLQLIQAQIYRIMPRDLKTSSPKWANMPFVKVPLYA